MNRIVIRSPRKHDARRLADIHLQACRYYFGMDPAVFQVPDEEGLVEWFETFLENQSEDSGLSLVAEVGGELQGSLEARILEPEEAGRFQMLKELRTRRLFVNSLEVDRNHWRSGVGTALMQAAERWGKERGATVALLDTYLKSPVSVPFYERLGYARHSGRFRKPL